MGCQNPQATPTYISLHGVVYLYASQFTESISPSAFAMLYNKLEFHRARADH